MQDAKVKTKLPKWPFLLGDILLLLAAYLVYKQSPRPMGLGHMGLEVLCFGMAACLGVVPFLTEYWAEIKLAGGGNRNSNPEQLRRLDGMLAQMTETARSLQRLQEEASKTAAGAGTSSSPSPTAPGSEDGDVPAQVRQLEESRRLEGEWVQVLVRMLDHAYALYVGAMRSGQPMLIEQVSGFQDACREAARSVGLSPLIAEPGEPFNAERHRWADGDGLPPAESAVRETIATGYTFQNRVLRPVSVRLLRQE